MTKQEQKQFVRELTWNVAKDMLKLIEDDRVPEGWDGHELRQWISERYRQVAFGSFSENKKRKRFQEYRNETITRNLL